MAGPGRFLQLREVRGGTQERFCLDSMSKLGLGAELCKKYQKTITTGKATTITLTVK